MPSDFQHDVLLSVPLLVLTLGAVLILMIEVFYKGEWPRAIVTSLVLLASLGTSNYLYMADYYKPGLKIFGGLMYADIFSSFIIGIILFTSIFVVFLAAEKLEQEKVESPGEYYSLLLMSTIGALIFASASEMITLFLGLEIMSMALYCLCGSAISIRASGESALKYFLLGSFSSAFLLYGIALLYGLTGSTEITVIAEKIALLNSPVLHFAIGLVMVGLLFKIGAVPFHFWAPDVYQGAPTSVTAYMASVIKASALFATIRIMWGAFPDKIAVWSGAVWTVAVVTMFAGNLIALRQRSLKRMLAYSSIAHAGYMLVALLIPDISYGGGAAILFYLVAYTAMTLGAFGVVLAVASARAGEEGADDITNFNGLSSRSPLLAALMAVFMLSLAGIPPGMAGLLGKFYIFNAAVKAGFVGIAIIGVINSAISAYYYLRVIVSMYFVEEKDSEDIKIVSPGMHLTTVLVFCAAGVVVLGIFPSAIHESATLIMQTFLVP